ncbi:MAG: hypothetical protein ABEL76_16610, partial [Bradymonadaceae bacterium]
MGIHVVGLDLGMRSIKMIGLDTSSRPRIEFFDEEELPTEGVDYLSSPDAPTGSTSPGAAGDEESDASDSTAETSDSSSPATDETPSETDDGPDDEVDGGPDREVLTVWQRALDDLLSRHEFRDDTVFVTYLPEGRAISIHQDVPFSDPRKVESILPDLLEDRLPLDPDDIVYDFEVLAGGGDDNTA